MRVAQQVTGRIIVPITVIPEIAYLLLTRRSHRAMRLFIRELQQPVWNVIGLDGVDLARIFELLDQYQDARLDFADASIVTVAERLNVETVLTLDKRDFYMIRPLHTDHFTILP